MKDIHGMSALEAAYANGHKEIAKLLTDVGTNDKEGITKTYSCLIL